MIRKGVVYFGLFWVLLLVFSGNSYAQCQFDVTAALQQQSDCQSNGVVKATLSGEDVDNGNVELSDAQFSIASTVIGGYSASFSTNGGVLANVPPGTYTVTARVYCAVSNSWVIKHSGTVTVTGSYVVPDLNRIHIVTADIVPSLKCDPTGVIPIKVEGGKAPYTITITSAPAGYTGATVFGGVPSGVFNINNLPAGNYAFTIRDDCTYTIPLSTSLGEILPQFSLGIITHTKSCTSVGVIPVNVSKGKEPYTITLTNFPVGYAGATTFTQSTEGTYNIANLPAGNYTLTVKDDCGYGKQFTTTVQEIKPAVTNQNVQQTISCSATGGISFDLQNGLPPYTIVMVAPPAYTGATTFTKNTNGMWSIGNLPDGNYLFQIKDNCGYSFTANATIDIAKTTVTLKGGQKAQGCTATGSIVLDIAGGKAPYSVVLNSYPVGYSGVTIFNVASAGGLSITGLPAGSYSFDITDDCGETESITAIVEAETLEVDIAAIIKSLSCVATGKMGLLIRGGTPPYTVEILDAPPSYTGQAIFTNVPEGLFEIQDMPDGQYLIKVTDACGSSIIVPALKTFVMTPFESVPGDPFYDYFLPPLTADAACYNVRIKRNANDPDLDFYWRDNSASYYEVAFLMDDVGTKVWQQVTDMIDYTLPYTYKQMRDGDHFLVAYVRLKGTQETDSCYSQAIDTIRIKKDVITDVNAFNPSCSGFSLSFSQRDNDDGLFCYPYNWELRDSTNTVVKSGTGVTSPATQTVNNILPYGNLTLHFTDKEGFTWTTPVSYHWKNPSKLNIAYNEFDCARYSLLFDDPDICYPYRWILRKPDNSIVAQQTVIAAAEQKVKSLYYNTVYTLYVITNQNDTVQYPILQDKQRFNNYAISSEAAHCAPEIGKGYIRLFRQAPDVVFMQGTRIKYVSGPTVPAHPDFTLDSTQNNILEIYPFSSDTIVNQQNVDILPGTYVFEITDTCNTPHQLTINYEVYSAKNFTYTKSETCLGAEVYPSGQIYLGSKPVPTYFRIRSAPPGIAYGNTSVTQGGFLFLPESGQYIIQISAENGNTSCPVDTLIIDYSKLSVALDAKATLAYVCDKGYPGYIRIRSTGGVGPFIYDLIDNGALQMSNSTGVFVYGVAGATYTIRITDVGCGVSFEQDITMLDLSNERLIYGPNDVCSGGKIELHCVPMGVPYVWTGPEGFASADQNPVIDSVTVAMSGIYTITVQPEGCLEQIQQDIAVTVHQPDMPAGDTVNIQCLNSPPVQLTATATPGFTLKWYDTDGVTVLASAPAPGTAAVDTVTYYVSQVDDVFGCEGEKLAITAIISDLPDSVYTASAPDICPGVVPVVVVPQTYTGYAYNLYTAPSGGDWVGGATGTGDTVRITGTVPLTASTKYYVEVLNIYSCAARTRTAVDIAVVDYLYIKPDVLPPYKRDVHYSQQLITNAASPYVFSTIDALPDGLALSVLGEIAGRPPRNGKIDPKTFTVHVVDNDGCIAEKTYTLESELFVPQIITPNDDGKNDHFMKGYRVIIFDRLGIKIFEGDDGWDGTRNGKTAPPDTYFYILYYELERGEAARKVGYITILKR